MALLTCLPGSAAWALAAPVQQQGVDSASRKIAAETLFQEAALLMEQGDYAAACPKLEASDELDTAVGTLLYLADCYEHVGRLASAWARFREAQSLASAHGMADRERVAAERVAALEPRLSRVTLVVPGVRPPGFTVRLGGVAVPPASWGTPLPMDPGDMELEAAAPGHEAFQTRLRIAGEPGASITTVIPALSVQPQLLEFEPARRTPSRVGPHVERVDAGKTWRTVGLTFVGAGALGLVGGGVATVLAVRSQDASLKECRSGGRLCSSRGVSLREQAALQADVATVAVAAGATLTLTGVLMYTLPGSRQREVRVAIGPAGSGRGAVLGARGEF